MRLARLVAVAALSLAAPVVAQVPMPPPPPAPSPEPVAEPAPAPAATTVSHTRLVTLQPVPWPFGFYSGAFELGLTGKLSLPIGANVTAFTGTTGSSQTSGGNTNTASSTVSVVGVHVEPGINYFLVGKAPAGLWVGGRVELGFVAVTVAQRSSFTSGGSTSTNESASTVSGFTYGGHAMVGYTHVFDVGLTVQGGLGIGIASSTLSTAQSSGSSSSTSQPFFAGGSFGRASLAVGWAF